MILCSNNKDKFSWLKTSSKTFQVDTIGKNLVIGGYDHTDVNRRMLYVGRILHQFTHRIGSITGYLGNTFFKFIQDRQELEEKEYEVLTFESDFTYVPTADQYCEIKDYYWREYDGEIPEDAVPTGRDVTGVKTYMGQTYIHGIGMLTGQIYPGKQEVAVPAYGRKTVNYNIKILCSNVPSSLTWLRTNIQDFKNDTKGKEVMVGGWDYYANGIVHIGRIFYQGHVVIGNVPAYKTPHLFFPFEIYERYTEDYEVMIYNNCTTPPHDPKKVI